MLPKDAPKLEELLIQSEALPWREKSLKGISEKMLWRDEQTGASIALIKFAEGAGIPQPHYHASNQFMFCLKGKYEYTGRPVQTGRCSIAGFQDPSTTSTRPTRFLVGSNPTPPIRTGTLLSSELSRLSPMTKRCPGGTVTADMLSSRPSVLS